MNKLLFILALICSSVCCAQSNESHVDINLDSANYAFEFPREYVVLKYDKENGMYPGDTIHFSVKLKRAVVVEKELHLKGFEANAPHSSIAYVDVLNPHGDVVESTKLRLDSLGSASHWIALDSILPSGFYEIRAYTRYMTNWNDAHYFSKLLPVFLPEHRIGKIQKEGTRYIDGNSWRIKEFSRSDVLRAMKFDHVTRLLQPMENNLMVFGRIKPKARTGRASQVSLADRHFDILISQGGKNGFTGEVVTDSLGRYALYFPDLKGRWSMRIKKNEQHDDMKECRVRVEEDFCPYSKMFDAEEIRPELFGYEKFKDDPTVSNFFFKYFDCEGYSYASLNSGLVSQGFYQWLGRQDRRFSNTVGPVSPTILNLRRDTIYNKYVDLDFISSHQNADSLTVCVDGPGFDNRPIVWIVNGEYRLVTNLNKKITDFEVLRPSSRPMPLFIDEVKWLAFTDNPDAFLPYVRSSVLEKKKPITVFIKMHEYYRWDDSGYGSIVFRGFDN